MTSGEVTDYVPSCEGDLQDVPDLQQLVPDALHFVQLLLIVHHKDVGPAVLGQ